MTGGFRREADTGARGGKSAPGQRIQGLREEALSLDSGQAVISSGHHLAKRVWPRGDAINTVLG
ncbi:hypothetical protein SBA4_1640017 [Candidatus Sulfopaludibacter sp. SbA4]|nr:hypothetical protein SBA4_1640017 [Candidatus Sulfopaludibacter sp. SbA4]